jgi:hypothetical protein
MIDERKSNMAKKASKKVESTSSDAPAEPTPEVEQQAQQQTGQQQVRVRIDEREVNTAYANAFRANATAEEIILDFGLNVLNPASQQQEMPEIIFSIDQRIIMNYYSVKRLALTLGQMIRRHEEQFGELELDVNARRTSKD